MCRQGDEYPDIKLAKALSSGSAGVNVNVVKILLGRNADVGHKDFAGMTALDKAASQNHDEVFALFKQQ